MTNAPPETAAPAPATPLANRLWALGMGVAFLAMLGLFAWIWKDLDHRIAAGKELEAKTGKKVGPELRNAAKNPAAPPP